MPEQESASESVGADFLTAADAARLTGRNEKTIRRAIDTGRLPAEIDERSAYKIARSAVLALYPPKAPHVVSAPTTNGQSAQEQSEAAAVATSEPDEEPIPEPFNTPTYTAPTWKERAIAAETQLRAVRAILRHPMNATAWELLGDVVAEW